MNRAKRHVTGVLVCVGVLLSGCMAARETAQVDATAAALSPAQASVFSSPDTSISFRQRVGDGYARIILNGAKLSTDTALQGRLDAIVAALSETIENRSFTYKVHLLDDDKPNAFTAGGGHLFVTTGLVGLLDSEGQMAMVLAHEMAHNEMAHVVKGAHHRALAARAASFSEEVLDKQLGLTWIGSGFDFLVQTRLNTYTRDQEDKADLLGLQYIVAAGYDPYVAPRAVHQLSGGRHTQSEWTNFFKGKHPTSQSRIWRLNNLIKAYFYNVDIANARRSTPAYDRATARYREKSEADT